MSESLDTLSREADRAIRRERRAEAAAAIVERYGEPASAAPGVYPTSPPACPQCATAPAYKRVPADPWGYHVVCASCGFSYFSGSLS